MNGKEKFSLKYDRKKSYNINIKSVVQFFKNIQSIHEYTREINVEEPGEISVFTD